MITSKEEEDIDFFVSSHHHMCVYDNNNNEKEKAGQYIKGFSSRHSMLMIYPIGRGWRISMLTNRLLQID
jgi:hypothetical protein